MNAGDVIAIVGIVVPAVMLLVGWFASQAEKRATERFARLEQTMGERFDSLDKEILRSRERLHRLENNVAALIGLDRVKKLE